MSNITAVDADDDKYETRWGVYLVQSKSGRYYEGRPETVLALAGSDARVIRQTERVYVGSREACERQL